jgi:hypothetical protein
MKSSAGAADLALIEPDRVDQAFDGAIDVGILEDDVGRLAAELQSQRLAAACRFLADEAADFGRAGEGDLVDVPVLDEFGSRCAIAGDDIENALGQARLCGEFGKQKCRE